MTCNNIDTLLNLARQVRQSPGQTNLSPPRNSNICSPLSLSNNSRGQTVPLPGGEYVQVEWIYKGGDEYHLVNGTPGGGSSNDKVLIGYVRNDFYVDTIEANNSHISDSRSPSFPNLIWSYSAINQQHYTIVNSEGRRIFLGRQVSIGILNYDDGSAYRYGYSTRTLKVNGVDYEPFSKNSDNNNGGGNNNDPENPPPCDIPITSNFDAGYFCMTFEEYNRFINDINRVEENLRRFE